VWFQGKIDSERLTPIFTEKKNIFTLFSRQDISVDTIPLRVTTSCRLLCCLTRSTVRHVVKWRRSLRMYFRATSSNTSFPSIKHLNGVTFEMSNEVCMSAPQRQVS
jgi:hypothetical protein